MILGPSRLISVTIEREKGPAISIPAADYTKILDEAVAATKDATVGLDPTLAVPIRRAAIHYGIDAWLEKKQRTAKTK